MKRKNMKLFEPLTLKFEVGNWASDPELGLIDTILELKPELIKMMEEDITQDQSDSGFGRQDMPSVEQIVRAAIYKEMKGLTYRELEYAQEDSRIANNYVLRFETRLFQILKTKKPLPRPKDKVIIRIAVDGTLTVLWKETSSPKETQLLVKELTNTQDQKPQRRHEQIYLTV